MSVTIRSATARSNVMEPDEVGSGSYGGVAARALEPTTANPVVATSKALRPAAAQRRRSLMWSNPFKRGRVDKIVMTLSWAGVRNSAVGWQVEIRQMNEG